MQVLRLIHTWYPQSWLTVLAILILIEALVLVSLTFQNV